MDKESHLDRGNESLRDHIVSKTQEARAAYGASIDYQTIQAVLRDSRFVRYPVRLEFNAQALQPGEFAHVDPIGEHPQDGFVLYIHSFFEQREECLPLLIAYHLVCINYGDIASHEEAELFGASLLGLEIDTYYQKLCELTDSIPQ